MSTQTIYESKRPNTWKAKKQENSLAKKEFLQLGEICEEVANDMDDRRVSG